MTIKSALRDLNNAILDFQSADYNTFQRPLEKMAEAMKDAEFQSIAHNLKSNIDFDAFMENATNGGSMMGSARLNWPAKREDELGLAIELIERAAKDPSWFLNFAHRYYYSGNKIVGDIRKITSAVLIPFNRDLKNHVEDAHGDDPVSQVGVSTIMPSVTYNIGSMSNSPLQHVAAGASGNQNVSYSTGELATLILTYRENVDDLDLSDMQRRKADAQVATLEAQLQDDPDPTIVAAAGRSLKSVIEGALGGAAGNLLSSAPVWAPLLSMFS